MLRSSFIPLPKPVKIVGTEHPHLYFVPKEEFEKHKKILNWTFGFVVAALAICFTTFILLIIDAWRFHSSTVEKNSNIIERLEKENRELIFQALTERIKELEKQKITSVVPESQRR